MLCALLVLASNLFAESLPRDYWHVISDQKDDSVKKNTCLVTGKVASVYSGSPVVGGVISNLDRSSNTKTNLLGEFSLVLSSKDTAIFFYHPEYSEIVCWNYNFQSGHHVNMNFVTSEKLEDGMMIMEEKPVVYLYSDKDLSVNLKYSNAADFTFSYPTYNEQGWDVSLDNNNMTVDGNSYPYLFWEGFSSEIAFQHNEIGVQADFINTDSTIQYLEGALDLLGFNSTEKADFITYWGPKVINHPYAQIQFVSDDSYDQLIGEVISSVEIDSKKRVYMIFQGSQSSISPPYLLKQELKSFARKGFTLVEWGGSELAPRKQL